MKETPFDLLRSGKLLRCDIEMDNVGMVMWNGIKEGVVSGCATRNRACCVKEGGRQAARVTRGRAGMQGNKNALNAKTSVEWARNFARKKSNRRATATSLSAATSTAVHGCLLSVHLHTRALAHPASPTAHQIWLFDSPPTHDSSAARRRWRCLCCCCLRNLISAKCEGSGRVDLQRNTRAARAAGSTRTPAPLLVVIAYACLDDWSTRLVTQRLNCSRFVVPCD